ncbi:MAG: hypothetical protein FWD75_04870 [Propionibacteriaceae bacterium]|nr:hypothetical protein [Propionibacteriaceae bacterium]
MGSHGTDETAQDETGDARTPDVPTRRKRSPQEEKALDYSKQRRNRYGENPEASRTGIRKSKARDHRRMRRAVAEELLHGEDADVAPIVTRLTRKRFRKWPDVPLGEVVDAKIAARAHVQDNPVVNDDARARRRERRADTSR